jgi:DNA (cytosine-5)-methyltransferase 1
MGTIYMNKIEETVMMKHGSLFSGIGGFDLAASWMDWHNVFNCERDPFCRTVLNHYWPDTESYGDIYQFNATNYRGCVDIISGGFPCQPFSQAGQRKGKEDDRYLWPEARRIIMEAMPKWIVLENVAGLFTILEPDSLSEMEIKEMELFCEDSKQEDNAVILRLQRRVIGTIISEIGTAGYLLPRLADGTPVVLCVPACAVGAPHRRDRVWFVAYSNSSGKGDNKADLTSGTERYTPQQEVESGRGQFPSEPVGFCTVPFDHLTNVVNEKNGYVQRTGNDGVKSCRPEKYQQHNTCKAHELLTSNKEQRKPGRKAGDHFGKIPSWNEWPAQPPLCSEHDGFPRNLDGISFSKWRGESIKAYGNAIVPQVALEIFRAIQNTEDNRATAAEDRTIK